MVACWDISTACRLNWASHAVPTIMAYHNSWCCMHCIRLLALSLAPEDVLVRCMVSLVVLYVQASACTCISLPLHLLAGATCLRPSLCKASACVSSQHGLLRSLTAHLLSEPHTWENASRSCDHFAFYVRQPLYSKICWPGRTWIQQKAQGLRQEDRGDFRRASNSEYRIAKRYEDHWSDSCISLGFRSLQT